VTLLDGVGNVSVPMTTLFIIDSVAPMIPTVTSAGGDMTPTYVTSDSTPIFTGSGEANNTFIIRNASGTIIATGTVDASGNWTHTPTTPIPDGSYAYNITTIDAAGNTSLARLIPLIIDTTTPLPPSISNPTASGTSSTATPTLTGTGEAGSVFTVRNASGTIL
jgi:large repetitive protein